MVDVKVNERNEGANDRTKDRRNKEEGGRIFKMKLSCLGQNRFYDSAPLRPSARASPSCREGRRTGRRREGGRPMRRISRQYRVRQVVVTKVELTYIFIFHQF